MESQSQKNERERRITRFHWVIGAPYFVQGTSTLTEIPILYFIKFTLQMGESGGQLFDALRQTGWFIKPLWGILSDKVPIFGYHRKSWYILMAFAATVFWLLNALLAFVGITVPLVYLVTFNLAFATYAFVDVVCDALMVTHGRRSRRVGSFINFQWAVLALANAGSVYLGGWLQGRIRQDIYEPWHVFLLTGIPPLITAVVGIRNIDEEPVPGARRHGAASALQQADIRGSAKRTLRRLRALPQNFRQFRHRNRAMWLLILFIFFWKFSPSVGYIERSYLIDVRGFTAASFGTIDERTLILQMFVYISLFFTLLTIPFIEMLRRELARQGVEIRLAGGGAAG